jgi:hypothetical protein
MRAGWSHVKAIGLFEAVFVGAMAIDGETGPLAIVMATLITLLPAVPVRITHPL